MGFSRRESLLPLTFPDPRAIMRSQKNTRQVKNGLSFLKSQDFSCGDKEIAVQIRSNSHYRNAFGQGPSRNAYPAVTDKGLSGNGRGAAEKQTGKGFPFALFSRSPWRALLFILL